MRASLLLVSALAACAPPVEVLDPVLLVSPDMPTVATLTWATSEPARCDVAYGPDGELLTPVEDGEATEHEVTLLGLPPNTPFSWAIQVEGQEEGAEGEGSTGTLPTDLPLMTVQGQGMEGWMVTTLLGTVTGPIILDGQGRPVWFHREDRELDVYRARLSVDGKSVLYNAASVSGDPADDSEIVRVSLDGATVESIPIPLLAHDFVELPDGTLAALQVEDREVDGVVVRGNRIVEVAPGGEPVSTWTTWDCFDPALHPGDDPALGWTFANALDHDAENDDYLVSLRNFSSIVRVDRATGACEAVLGDEAATYTFASGSQRFMHSHQFDWWDNHLLVFDNEGASGMVSRVLEYTVDDSARTLTETWSYTADPEVYVFVLGDVHRYEDGDTLVTWSVSGQVDRVAPDGTLDWRLNASMGGAFGFNVPVGSLYGG